MGAAMNEAPDLSIYNFDVSESEPILAGENTSSHALFACHACSEGPRKRSEYPSIWRKLFTARKQVPNSMVWYDHDLSRPSVSSVVITVHNAEKQQPSNHSALDYILFQAHHGVLSSEARNEVGITTRSNLTIFDQRAIFRGLFQKVSASLYLDIERASHLCKGWDADEADQIDSTALATARAVVPLIATYAAVTSITTEAPLILPIPDGSLLFKWASEAKELAVTIRGASLEVVRWHPRESYESEGYWEISSLSALREHLSWLVR